MVAAGGGIGGGGILVPIYILVMKFSPKHAIPLSNITVFGGAVANTILNSQKRHPLADRPMVDWDLILIMEPLTIAGALMGAFLNKLLREEVLVVMLVLLLSFTAYNTLKKAMKMYRIESIHLARERQKENELTAMKMENLIEEEAEAEDELLAEDDDDTEVMEEVEINDELRQLLQEEKIAPKRNIYILIMLFITILTMNLLKGGGAFKSPLGIKCGGRGFWIANASMLLLIVGISFWVKYYLMEKHERKVRCGFKYVEGDIRWDGHATTLYPLICTLAGFFAGMFGVGGGIVKGPLMLAMGVHPKVSSASSAVMILFTSFTATSSFIAFGLLVYDYAFVCLMVGFFATYVGQIALYYLMSKYERNSYIAFSIGGVVLLSALLMTVQSLVSMAEHGGGKEPQGICKGS
jgi:Predicted permeases